MGNSIVEDYEDKVIRDAKLKILFMIVKVIVMAIAVYWSWRLINNTRMFWGVYLMLFSLNVSKRIV